MLSEVWDMIRASSMKAISVYWLITFEIVPEGQYSELVHQLRNWCESNIAGAYSGYYFHPPPKVYFSKKEDALLCYLRFA